MKGSSEDVLYLYTHTFFFSYGMKRKRTETSLKRHFDLLLFAGHSYYFFLSFWRFLENAASIHEGKLHLIPLCARASLFLTLGKKKNVWLKSTNALFNSTMPFYFTLRWAGGGQGGDGGQGMDWKDNNWAVVFPIKAAQAPEPSLPKCLLYLAELDSGKCLFLTFQMNLI